MTYKKNEKEHSMENIVGELRRDDRFIASGEEKKSLHCGNCIQKTTLQGLENVVKCVDVHLKHLQSLADNINECARYLIKEIKLKLSRSYIDCDIIKLILKGNYDEIERNVRIQINDFFRHAF